MSKGKGWGQFQAHKTLQTNWLSMAQTFRISQTRLSLPEAFGFPEHTLGEVSERPSP